MCQEKLDNLPHECHDCDGKGHPAAQFGYETGKGVRATKCVDCVDAGNADDTGADVAPDLCDPETIWKEVPGKPV